MRLDIDSSLQTNDSKWLDSFCDSTRPSHDSTRKNFRWLWLDKNDSGTSLPFSCTIVGAARDYFMNFVSDGRANAVFPSDCARHNKYMSPEFINRIDLCLPYCLLWTSVMLGTFTRIMLVLSY